MGIIYSFKNKENQKQYIGQSINEDDSRYKNHKSAASNEKAGDYDTPLHRAFRKYGFENFEYNILARGIDDVDLLNLLERYYIQKYDTQVPNGYNIESGGNNCQKPKDSEQRKKLIWAQAELTPEEIVELRIAYKNHESPSKIYHEKYENRLHYAAFLNIWSGRRYAEIMPDCLEKGRHTVLSQEKADEIRERRKKESLTYAKLAEIYGCSSSTIADIISGRTWKHSNKE